MLGTITPHAEGLRLDATWRTDPVGCDRLAKATAKNLGAVAVALYELGARSGTFRAAGNAQASGTVTLDTTALETARFSVTTKETCGVSVFGSRPL